MLRSALTSTRSLVRSSVELRLTPSPYSVWATNSPSPSTLMTAEGREVSSLQCGKVWLRCIRISITLTIYTVSKVETNHRHETYENWGPEFKISFDLMILETATELKSIFAFLGDHFESAPLILLRDLDLYFRTSNSLAGEEFSYDYPVQAKKWIKIEITQTRQYDATVRICFFDLWINDDLTVWLLHQSQWRWSWESGRGLSLSSGGRFSLGYT